MHSQPSVFSSLQGFLRKTQNAAAHVAHGSARLNVHNPGNTLLALRDAAQIAGRKAVVVFSNGPDNASVVAPDDVGAVAEDEGIPIYVISTNDGSRDAISAAVFQRITTRTGGRLYWAQTWQDQTKAFAAVSQDIGNSYVVAYYPAPNPNRGFRTIKVDIVSGKKCVVRARLGYRPRLP